MRPVKNRVVGAGVVVCLEQGADLHMAQLMPLPLTVSCFRKIQIGFFLFWVFPEKGLLNGCVCVFVLLCSKGFWSCMCHSLHTDLSAAEYQKVACFLFTA